MKNSSILLTVAMIIFSALNSIDIHDCISAALENSVSLQNEEYRIKNLGDMKAQAWLAFVPQISLYSSAIHDLDGNQYGQAGITVSEYLYLLDDRWSGIKLARLELEREEIEYMRLRNDLILETIGLYTNLLIQLKKIEYYRQAYESYQQEIEYIRELIPVGSRTQLDLLSAEIELQNLQLDLERTDNEIDKILLELNHKTGLGLNRESEIFDIDTEFPEEKQQSGYELNFNWRQQELTNSIKKVSRRQEFINLLPDLYLGAYYNWKYLKYWEDKAELYDFEGNFISRDQEQDYWEVSLNLSFPLGTLSKRLYDYGIARRNYRMEMNNTVSLKQELTREMQGKLLDLQLRRRELEIGRNRLDLTGKKLDLARERYYSGLISFYDYNTARNDYLSARISLTETQYAYLLILCEYQDLAGEQLLGKY